MANLAQLRKPLKWTCPCCAAKIDADLSFCGACGYGLPSFPRPRFLVVGSTLLFMLVGFPCGVISMYALAYMIADHVVFWPIFVVGLVVCLATAKLMCFMDEGTKRPYRGKP